MTASGDSDTPPNRLHSKSWRKWGLALALAIAVAALYRPAVRFSFLNFDDDKYVTANPHVQAGISAATLKWSFTANVVGHWQPITLLSHALDCHLYGLESWGHHLTSILWHGANAILMFLVLAYLTGSIGRSFLVAALFAVHPLNIENVAWIAERKTLVSAFFSLLTIAAYAFYSKRPGWSRWLLVTGCFVVALAAKATAITLPVIFLVLDYWPLNRIAEMGGHGYGGENPGTPLRRLVLEKIPWFVLCGVSAYVTIAAQAAGKALAALPLSDRIAHALWAYSLYLAKLLWPYQTSILYPYVVDPWWKVTLGVVVLLGVSGVVFRLRSTRYLTTGWLFFLISMLPVIGIIQAGRQAYADRYLYLPELGIFIIAVWGGDELSEKLRIGKTKYAFAGAVLVAFAAVTAANLPFWKNSYAAFSHAEHVVGSSDFVIENNLAQGLSEIGRPVLAILHYRRAITLKPNDPLPHYDLAAALAATGDTAGAIDQYETALRCAPERDLLQKILNNLAAVFAEKGDVEKADRNYAAAIELDPANPIPHFGRAKVLYKESRFKEASEEFGRAAELHPHPVAYYWLGRSLVAEGKKDQALRALSDALRLNPHYAEAQEELARIENH